MTEDIKKFTEAFFKNLKAEIEYSGNLIIVKNVPKDFEDFAGKKSPYYLAFEPNDFPEAELMSKGSFMLKSMTSYLENKGQTTLIKLNFDMPEIKLPLKNCELFSIKNKINYKQFYRFTFQTIFQYLNEKEQVISQIFTDKNVIDFNLSKYLCNEGKKQEISMSSIKEDYETAKLKLKEILSPKISQVSGSLKEKLDSEIKRVKEHYQQQISEIDEKVKKIQEQIKELESGNTSGDLKNIPARINKLKEHLEEINKPYNKEKLIEEEKFFINDEMHKHSLNIDNKLINTTIIYYPVFLVTLFLKSKETGRQLELEHNPLNPKIELKCESCQSLLSEIWLCSSGHLSCQNCIQKCRECGNEFCKNCLDRLCEYCGKRICRKCSSKCLKCNRHVCKTHMKKDPLTGKQACIYCFKKCSSCNDYSESLFRCSCGREVCGACARKEFIKTSSGILCSSCSQKCPTCQKVKPKNHFLKCPGCNPEVCHHLNKCIDCRRQLCIKLKKI